MIARDDDCFQGIASDEVIVLGELGFARTLCDAIVKDIVQSPAEAWSRRESLVGIFDAHIYIRDSAQGSLHSMRVEFACHLILTVSFNKDHAVE